MMSGRTPARCMSVLAILADVAGQKPVPGASLRLWCCAVIRWQLLEGRRVGRDGSGAAFSHVRI
jgi:hypothetical protein